MLTLREERRSAVSAQRQRDQTILALQGQLWERDAQLELRQCELLGARNRIGALESEMADIRSRGEVPDTTQQHCSTDEAKRDMLGDPRSLVVPDGTEAIEKFQHAEKDCERVFVPRSVAEIRDSAFYGCENLTEVVFEEGSRLVTIGDSAFQNCRNIARISLPDGLRSIG